MVALLLMRHEVLQPGQAVFMPAGGLHAYLRGTGIDCSPTPTTWSAPASPASTSTCPNCSGSSTPRSPCPCSPRTPSRDGITTFDTPAPEFRLYLINLPAPPALALPGTGPRILLCLDGACSLRAASGQHPRPDPRRLLFIPFADGPVHATGPARLALATPGDLAPDPRPLIPPPIPAP